MKLNRSAVSLRFFGDDLDPDEITRLLGAEPTKSERKGDEIIGRITSQKRLAQTGGWRLTAGRRTPGDLDAQIAEILDQLTDNPDVWNDLTNRFRADVFCGLFMVDSNEGVCLSNATLQALATRGLEIDFDIYHGNG